MQARFDVIAVGHAIVDVLAHVSDAFLTQHGIAKGAMTLIDAFRAETLEHAMSKAIEASGGSAANTAVGVASFGGSAAFIGKVRDDRLGGVFAEEIRKAGVAFEGARERIDRVRAQPDAPEPAIDPAQVAQVRSLLDPRGRDVLAGGVFGGHLAQ